MSLRTQALFLLKSNFGAGVKQSPRTAAFMPMYPRCEIIKEFLYIMTSEPLF